MKLVLQSTLPKLYASEERNHINGHYGFTWIQSKFLEIVGEVRGVFNVMGCVPRRGREDGGEGLGNVGG